jgi:RNA polymerase sigma-70 factor (ECF subfamily)
MTFDQSDTRTDSQLLVLSRAGDPTAFGQLAAKHYRSCVSVATSVLRDRVEAEDEAQQAIWKAFQHLDQYLGEAGFSTWLMRIVVNECRMVLRSKRRAHLLSISGAEGSDDRPMELVARTADPEHLFAEQELMAVLRTEIRRIPPLMRQVVILRDVQGLSMPEVAGRLGITVPAAKSRLLRARTELRFRIIGRYGTQRNRVSETAARSSKSVLRTQRPNSMPTVPVIPSAAAATA